VLRLNFTFSLRKYLIDNENENITVNEEANSSLRIQSYLNKDVFIKNPIGQTGVPIVLLIYAEQFYYNISINGGDIIHYKNGLPPWAANYVMVTFFELMEVERF